MVDKIITDIPNAKINEILHAIEDVLDALLLEYPIISKTMPGYLCLDMGLNDLLQNLKIKLRKKAAESLDPIGLKRLFEMKLASLQKEEKESLEDGENETAH